MTPIHSCHCLFQPRKKCAQHLVSTSQKQSWLLTRTQNAKQSDYADLIHKRVNEEKAKVAELRKRRASSMRK